MLSSTSFKICYNGEIHRCSKPIAGIKDLKDSFKQVYKGKLPLTFKMQYLDEDDDIVLLNDEKDYKTMINTTRGQRTIKIYIKGDDDEYEIIDRASLPEDIKVKSNSTEETMYTKEITRKARLLKELIPENCIDVYLHYVSLDPERSVDELAEDYLSQYAQVEKSKKKKK